MTEPRVEAGDRALETARKIHSYIFKLQGFDHADIHECHCCDELADEIQSAMNAQERELREALRGLLDDLICRCDVSLIPLKNIDGTCARCNRKTYRSETEEVAERLVAEHGEGA